MVRSKMQMQIVSVNEQWNFKICYAWPRIWYVLLCMTTDLIRFILKGFNRVILFLIYFECCKYHVYILFLISENKERYNKIIILRLKHLFNWFQLISSDFQLITFAFLKEYLQKHSFCVYRDTLQKILLCHLAYNSILNYFDGLCKI